MLVLRPEYVCLPYHYHNIYRAFLDAVAEFQERVLQVIRGQNVQQSTVRCDGVINLRSSLK